ncbi:MAG: trypsin-like peptidase domain-containing protein [Acidimicrobiales bacterium]|jgi:S1-C subfamily serine protease
MDNEFESPESTPEAETGSPEAEVGSEATTAPEAAAAEPEAAAAEPAMPESASPVVGGWIPDPSQSGWNPYAAQPSTPPSGMPAWTPGAAAPHPDPDVPRPTPPAGTAAWAPMPAPADPLGPYQAQSPAWGGWPQPATPSWVPGSAAAGAAGAPPGQPIEIGEGWPMGGSGGLPPTGGPPPAPGGYGFPEGDPEPATPGAKPGRSRRVLVGALGAVVLLAAIGGGVLIGKSSSPTKAQTTATQPIPSPSNSGSPGTNAKINVSAIAAKVDPAVVDITSIDQSSGEEAAGTGMILTSNGEVLTNNHVIADGTSITAQIDGKGTTYKVRVLGTDTKQDVALVQLVGASGLSTVSIGNSSSLQVGDPVVAIGNALDLKGPPTVTQGIVSALGRSISASDEGTGVTENLSGLIQTDAPINPGNSGGPLVNAAGQVIGMDTAAASGSSTQAATNIGFAIPINEAIAIAQQIQQGKGSSSVLINNKGFIGVEVITIAQAEAAPTGIFGAQYPTPGTNKGAYVAGILQGTPAVQSGLKEGDVITAVNGTSVATPVALGAILSKDKPGQSVNVTWIDPSGGKHSATISLGARPVA